MWDIFCSVIDHYGDVGVCWRLSRLLSAEHSIHVRLWIDDLHPWAAINPQGDPDARAQWYEGVEVRKWEQSFAELEPGEVVIEAFGCRPPENFVRAMAARAKAPVWINLEYLSAEDWVGDFHRKPSPHPNLPLCKYFFFPGFAADTGGLLRESDLQVRRARFGAPAQLEQFWRSHGMLPAGAGELRVSLFSYENAPLSGLLSAWAGGPEHVTCLAPMGVCAPAIGAFFGKSSLVQGDMLERDCLRMRLLPFTDQLRYDHLLWACDINFVRGEDSFVRAQWAAHPWVWQIYPQHNGAHHAKLDAFLDRYCVGLSPAAATAARTFFHAWNDLPDAPEVGAAWQTWRASWPETPHHARIWSDQLSRGLELCNELVKFVQAHIK